MSGLRWLIMDYLEMCAGRITWRNFVYLFLPAPPRKRRMRNWKDEEWPTRIDATGREYSVFKGRGAYCRHPTLWLDKYPKIEYKDKSYHSVPAVECKGCHFHEDARYRRKFACCLWDRQQHSNSPTPSQLASVAVRQAKALVDKCF
jgi:hypothetical protein